MKRNIIYYIITILTALSLIGCAVNPNEISKAKTSDKTVTFSGVIDSGRSAGVDLSTLVWKVEATKKGSNDGKVPESESETKLADMTGSKWSISLPRDGAVWTIYASGTLSSAPNNNIYYGSIDVTADAESKPNLSIPVRLVGMGSNTGTINLTVKKDSDVTSVTKVEVTGLDDQPDQFTFSENTAIVTKSKSVGSYPVTISFLDDAGNVLYQCRESISVLSGCTTDTWLGNSSYIQNGEFTLTAAMIDRYGTEIVPNTGMVVYSISEAMEPNMENDYYSIDANGERRSDLSLPSFEYEGGKPCPVSFCYDNSENLYIVGFNEDDDLATIYVQKADGSQLQNISSDDFPLYYSFHITFDRKTNTLYGATFNRDDNTKVLNLYSYPEILSNSANPTNNMKWYSITKSTEMEDDILASYGDLYAINGNQLYIPCFVSTNIKLITVYLPTDDQSSSGSDTPYPITISESDIADITPNESYIQLSDQMQITDCLYQDGCIYMLLREFYLHDNNKMNCSSRGAVMKYDLITKAEPEILGWTSNPLPTIGKYTYLSRETYDGDCFVISYDNNDDMSYVVIRAEDVKTQAPVEDPETGESTSKDVSILNLYAPISTKDDLSNDAFYGPQRFVAIRPKKLVIADDGLAFYTDDYDAFCAKNVNRIVTVDLESFSIENNEIRVNGAIFNGDHSGFIHSGNIFNGGFKPYDEQYVEDEPVCTFNINVYTTDNKTDAIPIEASVYDEIGNPYPVGISLFEDSGFNATPAIPIKD